MLPAALVGRMEESAFEGLDAWDIWPLPPIQDASCLDQNIRLVDETLLLTGQRHGVPYRR
jgi:hypothetical protein